MYLQRTTTIGLAAAALLLITILLLPLMPAQAAATQGGENAAVAAQGQGFTETIEVDVAEDMNRFIFDQDVVFADGLPADGSSFITRGYLYPAGTLECQEGSCTGLNPDGSPEFPGLVIGEWICQGYMINDAAHATAGVWVFSTQFFQFGDVPGAETVVTTGYELADLDAPVARAITGGTGEYALARGESSQSLVGLNASEGVVLRATLEVRKR